MTIASYITRATDTVIGAINPRKAAIRRHFRLLAENDDYRQLVFALMGARGYRSAKQKAALSAGSADAELITDLPAMRNKCREINRDDPIGSGLMRTFVTNVVGTGLRPRATTGDADKDKKLEAVFAERCNAMSPADDCIYAEMQRVMFAKVLEDGEVFRKLTKNTPEEPVWMETVEAERVGTPLGHDVRDQMADPAGDIVNGVEKDRHGIPTAYWIMTAHPGDTVAKIRNNKFQRVEKQYCNHLKLVRRPGQTRGEPIFHAIIQDLNDLDLLLLASLKRVQIAACLAVFIKSDAKAEDLMELTAAKEGYVMDQEITPGMMFKLGSAESIETLLPNFPTPELVPFIVMIARRIGAALGVSWQVVLKDFSQSTYSSARTDLLESRPTFIVWRNWFVEKGLKWEWKQVLLDARLRGDPRMADVSDADIMAIQFFGDGWKWIDPKKEMEAIEIELRLGLSLYDDVWMEMGKDPELMWKKLEAQVKRCNQIGLGTYSGATAAAITATKDDDEEDDDEDDDDAPNNNGKSRGTNGTKINRIKELMRF